MQIWSILISAAHGRKTLTYGDIAKYLDYKGAGVLSQPLDRVMVYCKNNGYPPLTCLVVNQETGLPGDGLTTVENLPKDREKVYQKNWYALYPPQFVDFIKS